MVTFEVVKIKKIVTVQNYYRKILSSFSINIYIQLSFKLCALYYISKTKVKKTTKKQNKSSLFIITSV